MGIASDFVLIVIAGLCGGILARLLRRSCAKHFGSQTRRFRHQSPGKAEKVDQSNSSTQLSAAPKDTPALVKGDPHHLTLRPQAAVFSRRYS